MVFIAHQRKSDQKVQTVKEHLFGVAELSKIFTSGISLSLCGELLGLLHDLGKYSEEFQQYICSSIGEIDPDDEEYVDAKNKKGKIDHSTAGGQFIFGIECEHRVFPYLRQIMSLSIVSHHGGLIDCLSPDGKNKFSQRISKEYVKTHLPEVLEKCSGDILEKIRSILHSDEILAEFLAILKKIPQQFRDIYLGLLCRYAGKRERGIYSLTVPTGGGKTLASLRFALEHAAEHKLERIIYVIPYRSIIDQNAREVQKVFAQLSEDYGVELVLEHHSNLTPEEETPSQQLMSENWDAPIVYTTSVQLLDSLFKGGTRSARRMHSLEMQ